MSSKLTKLVLEQCRRMGRPADAPAKRTRSARAAAPALPVEVAPASVTSIALTLPYPPTANLYWRHYRGRTVLSKRAEAYRKSVADRAALAGCRPFAGDVDVKLDVFRPREIGDLDNTQKVLLDALRGFAFVDDKQVVRIYADRHDDAGNPRAEVVVTRTEVRTAGPRGRAVKE